MFKQIHSELLLLCDDEKRHNLKPIFASRLRGTSRRSRLPAPRKQNFDRRYQLP